MTVTQTIPVLDLREFDAGDEARQQFVTQLGQALEHLGFFAVTHHGVEDNLIQTAYGVASAFFSLPDQKKRRYEVPGLNGQRGFTRLGQEHAKDHPVPDLKEFWHIGRESEANPRCLENIVPVEVPAFHPTLARLYSQLEDCATRLLQACALYLGEPEFLLVDMVRGGETILRVIHYPPVPANAHPASLRSAPHEDINLITLLCEATDDGLELLQRDGTWLPVRAVPGQIIVDSGDMLHQLTNGLLKSTTHRVVNLAGDDLQQRISQGDRRFSMPFFVHPRPEVDLTPLPECVARTGGVPLPGVTAGESLQQRLQEIGLIEGSLS